MSARSSRRWRAQRRSAASTASSAATSTTPRPRQSLVAFYAAADVFVHPSRTDTFGLVMLEAMACGTPVAAFPVAGPLDVVGASDGGVLDVDLRRAALRALEVPRERARARALEFDWGEVCNQFIGFLVPARSGSSSVTELS